MVTSKPSRWPAVRGREKNSRLVILRSFSLNLGPCLSKNCSRPCLAVIEPATAAREKVLKKWRSVSVSLSYPPCLNWITLSNPAICHSRACAPKRFSMQARKREFNDSKTGFRVTPGMTKREHTFSSLSDVLYDFFKQKGQINSFSIRRLIED